VLAVAEPAADAPFDRAIWRFAPEWRAALDAPGAKHMAVLVKEITARAWWRLEPDQHHELVTSGNGNRGEPTYAVGARAADRSFALVYLPESRPIEIDLGRLSGGKVQARWLDPTTGAVTDVAGGPFPARDSGRSPRRRRTLRATPTSC